MNADDWPDYPPSGGYGVKSPAKVRLDIRANKSGLAGSLDAFSLGKDANTP